MAMNNKVKINSDVELKDLYRAFAKFLGWNMQDAENYLNGVPDYVLVTADISSQEFVRLYNAQSDKVDETTVKNKKRWSEALKAFLDKKENKESKK